jgi:hypothetical protein
MQVDGLPGTSHFCQLFNALNFSRIQNSKYQIQCDKMLVNDLLDLINSGIDFDAQNYMIMNTDKCFGGHSSESGPNHGNNTPRQCCGEFPAQGQVELSNEK